MKKTDLNSIIGFTLIGLILLGFSYFNQSDDTADRATSTEQTVATEAENQTEALPAETNVQTLDADSAQAIGINDSIQALALQQQLGVFATPSQINPKTEVLSLENENIRLQFSTSGAKIVSAELKAYQTYDSLPLMLVNENQQWDVLLGNGQDGISSNELHFSHQSVDNGLIFTAPTISGEQLEIRYSLEENGYALHMDISWDGLPFDDAGLRWEMNAIRHERNIETESQQTSLHYFLSEKEKHKSLSATSNDEEDRDDLRWIAYKQQFFSSILMANGSPFPRARLQSTPLESDQHTKHFGSLIELPSGSKSFSGSLLFSPNQYDLLKAHDQEFDELIPLGWGIFGWINRGVVINVFQFLERFDMNYGLVILIMALLIKLVLSPLTYSSYMSMAKMRVLKPEIDEINEKFADKDAMKKQQAMMELYRKAGVNPLGGCIPVLLQFPILIAVFRFFPASIELRQKSFLWANDLSTYDSILSLPFSIPFYGDHVSLFTLLMTVSTLLYTYFNNQLTQQNNQFPQLKYMMYLMPVMFLGFFNNYAAGLTYYYFISNMLTFGQQFAIRSMVDDDAIHAKLQENKKKPKKQSKFQKRLEEMAKQQKQQAQTNRRTRRQ